MVVLILLVGCAVNGVLVGLFCCGFVLTCCGCDLVLMFAFGLCVGYCVSVLLLRLIALRCMLLRSGLC